VITEVEGLCTCLRCKAGSAEGFSIYGDSQKWYIGIRAGRIADQGDLR
jgi:hypothetical protein